MTVSHSRLQYTTDLRYKRAGYDNFPRDEAAFVESYSDRFRTAETFGVWADGHLHRNGLTEFGYWYRSSPRGFNHIGHRDA